MGGREVEQRRRLGAAVRQARLRQGLTVRALADTIEVSASTISSIERGGTRVDEDRLARVAAALDVVATDLRDGPTSSPDAMPTIAGLSSSDWRRFDPLPSDPALDGAISAFVTLGFHGASVRAIAEHAGLSTTGVYHYYPSKDLILVRILELTMSDLQWRLDAATAEAVDAGSDAVRRFGLVVEALALFHASRRDQAFIGASEMRSLPPMERARIAAIRTGVQRRLEGEVRACIDAGLAPAQDVGTGGRAIATMCTSLCQWFRPTGALPAHVVARHYATYAQRLIGAEHPAPGGRGVFR